MTAAGDNLDRIEALDRLRNLRPKDLTRAEKDALVEIARAAQEYLEHTETSDFRRGHTNTACPPLTRAMCKPYMRLRAALARLNTKEGTAGVSPLDAEGDDPMWRATP